MSLSAGDRLGPYEILAPLGAGGMGQVWKARDPRLDRIVAIKVSREQFSERFELEARAVAALNHPHICQLYDIGPDYLVMEFIDGAPLKGPLPIEKAVDYAAQILDALDAAHQKGITHRDLKPDNILITKQGIKLLDFGLAKRQGALKETDATLTRAMTQQGQILGTFQYMSPEQLQGKEVDTRSDLFSFGCVLYEMLTGKRAFEGQSTASVIAAILEREPAPLTVAPRLERIVKRSLAKDPDQRFQTARDLKAALLWAMEHPPVSAGIKRSRVPWILIAAATLLIGAIGGWGISHFLQPAANSSVRFVIDPPSGSNFSGPPNAGVPALQFAVSPDGRAIVFLTSTDSARNILCLRNMDDVTAQPLAGTEGSQDPFWSPDSLWVGFFSGGKLKKIPVAGGPVQILAPALNPRGGSWGADGTILFAPGNGGLLRVASSGGAVTEVTKLDASRQEGSHRWPQFLPDGRHFLYLVRSSLPAYRGVYAGSIDDRSDSKNRKLLVATDSQVAYSPPAQLLYMDADTLLAQPFDASRLELSGQPSTIAEHVGRASTGYSSFSVAQAGVLAYAGPILHPGRLTWFDRDGKLAGSLAAEGDYMDFRLSPDERELAAALVDSKAGNSEIWISDIARGSTSRFTFGGTLNSSVAWSPDGAHIVFRTVLKGVAELYEKSASGGGQEEPVLSLEMQRAMLLEANNSVPTDWSPDGRRILFSTLYPNTQLWMLPLDSGGKPFRYIDSSADQMHGNFSPDGRLVAYSSNESGRFEVHIQTFPLSDRKWQVSISGGYEPRWRGDGRELYYLSEDRKLMAVSVGPGPSFGVPEMLFQTGVLPGVTSQRMSYVPSRDGKRFLVNTQTGDPPPNPITVVLNWTTGLKK
jgi:serine/threonine protein kinase